MVQFHACIGKLAPRYPVNAHWCVTAAVSLISRKGIFFVLVHRTRLLCSDPGSQGHRATTCVSLLLRLNKWKEITSKKRRRQ